MLDATTPAANLPLLVASNATVRTTRGAGASNRAVRLASTAIDGTFVLDDVVADGPLQVFAVLPPGQRLIGIDAGTKTLGLALSDVNRGIASPLETIKKMAANG